LSDHGARLAVVDLDGDQTIAALDGLNILINVVGVLGDLDDCHHECWRWTAPGRRRVTGTGLRAAITDHPEADGVPDSRDHRGISWCPTQFTHH
jgi:hypothetical protein